MRDQGFGIKISRRGCVWVRASHSQGHNSNSSLALARQLSPSADMMQQNAIGKADQFGKIGRLGPVLCPVVASSGMAAV